MENKDLLYNLHKIDSITDREALDLIAECILGPDWYVADPVTKEQANVALVRAVIERYDEANHTYIKQNWNRAITALANHLKVKIR